MHGLIITTGDIDSNHIHGATDSQELSPKHHISSPSHDAEVRSPRVQKSAIDVVNSLKSIEPPELVQKFSSVLLASPEYHEVDGKVIISYIL